MVFRAAVAWLIAMVVAASWSGCRSTSVERRIGCPANDLDGWEIPAGWIKRELTPTDARVEVLTANLSKPSMEAGWAAMRDQWQIGDTYWLYLRPDDEALHALGTRRGIVLIRGCEQLGFVTTRIETETEK